MMNYALLDNDVSFHQKFKSMANKYINYENCSFYRSSKAFFYDLQARENWHLDVLFLDIELNGESGIEIARKLYSYNSSIIVIFISDKIHKVYDAFGLNVFKFVFKPLLHANVDMLFNAIIEEFDMVKPIKIKSEDIYLSFSKKEIVSVSLELRKIYFHTADGRSYLTHLRKIKDALVLLNSPLFVLINRSEIINISYITELNGTKLRIGKLNKEYFISQDKLVEIRKKWRGYSV